MLERRGFGEYAKRTVKVSLRETGTLAYLLHRVTGILLTVYLFIHIGTMSLARFQGLTFEETMAMFRQPLFLFVDWVIFVGVLLHALNGLRITLFDLGIGIRRQVAIFWSFMALAGAVALWGLLIVVGEAMGGI